MVEQNTADMPVVLVPCRYLSSEFHRRLDDDYGRIMKENGGHVTYTIRMDGEKEPRWWEKIVRFLNGASRRERS